MFFSNNSVRDRTQKNLKRKKTTVHFHGRMWICMRPFSICATREIRSRRLQKPSPVYHLAVGTWNEQEGVRHRMSSKGEFANWNMRTKFFFLWWNPPPVLLYRATRSVRFHIHYDYLVACLLLPPSNSARRTGRIHTHTQTNASTD